MNRKQWLAVILAASAVVCGLGVWLTVAKVAPDLITADCTRGPSIPPTVSPVKDDVAKVKELMPQLGAVEQAHYEVRDSRPTYCPERVTVPMDHYYEGFAVVSAASVDALRTGHVWGPAIPPDVPAALAKYAPANAAWLSNSEHFIGTGHADAWLDPASRTVFFRYLVT
jgi:hypothetical protein